MSDNNEVATLSKLSKSLAGLSCRQAKRALEFLGGQLYERILAEDPQLAAEIGGVAAPAKGEAPGTTKIPSPLHPAAEA